MRRRRGVALLLVLLVSVSFVWAGKKVTDVLSDSGAAEPVVVVDAGHGGDDPGKVGINGALEKDINLVIAKFVASYLEQNGITVILTRDSDAGLEAAGSRNKKVEDLKNRMALIESSGAMLAVSIHQNSYTSETVHGAQVFYYETSKEGERAALLLQKQLTEGLQEERGRAAKKNGSYYLLKKSSVPTVIVECGFLSNNEEAEKLTQEDYQKTVAWNIALGILQYINGVDGAGADGEADIGNKF